MGLSVGLGGSAHLRLSRVSSPVAALIFVFLPASTFTATCPVSGSTKRRNRIIRVRCTVDGKTGRRGADAVACVDRRVAPETWSCSNRSRAGHVTGLANVRSPQQHRSRRRERCTAGQPGKDADTAVYVRVCVCMCLSVCREFSPANVVQCEMYDSSFACPPGSCPARVCEPGTINMK